jgi:hypothetical protein
MSINVMLIYRDSDGDEKEKERNFSDKEEFFRWWMNMIDTTNGGRYFLTEYCFPDEPEELQPGEQIAYIPEHAHGDVFHKDVQFGFVTKKMKDDLGWFCRYWLNKKYWKDFVFPELRTVANSEGTDRRHLVRYASVPQSIVDVWMKKHYPDGEFVE